MRSSPIQRDVAMSGCDARRRGFTLAEILIAILILGVGLSMAAAIFPAAMTYNIQWANTVLGNIVCQNGLSIARAKLQHGDFGVTVSEKPMAADGNYPAGSANDEVGFKIFGRQIEQDKNDYQLVVVAYRKAASSNVVSVKSLSPSAIEQLEDGRTRLTFASGADLQVGSPVISKGDGAYARIVAVDGAVAALDHSVPSGSLTAGVFVIFESNRTDKGSPAIAVLSTRTSLLE